jgi:2-hydroxychromene-2-carboxylate isomerase
MSPNRESNTQAAFEKGAFGAPTFFVGDAIHSKL